MLKLNLSLAAQVPVNLPAELHTAINDLYVQLNSIVAQSNRLQSILQSANGHYWALTISNSGAVSATDLGPVLPP